MNTIDVRTEMHKLAASKPVHAAAGVGVLATEALRELPHRIARLRSEARMSTLEDRARGYMTTARARALAEYERLARRGERALNGHPAARAHSELNGKGGKPRATTSPRATAR